MYDLIGRYDLLAKVRIPKWASFGPLRQRIANVLREKGQLFPEDKEPETLFSLLEVVNISREWGSIEAMGISEGEIVVPRMNLASTEDYERARCQKGFLYIDLHASKANPTRLIDQLRINLINNEPSSAIVQAIYRGDRAIIFDLFMTCAQSSLINRLNRVIESVIYHYNAQKYTLLSYGYDEVELSIPQPEPVC